MGYVIKICWNLRWHAHNHAFVDGNKRTAFMSADLFLFINGIELQQRQDTGYSDMMVNFAQGKISREEVASYLKQNVKARL